MRKLSSELFDGHLSISSLDPESDDDSMKLTRVQSKEVNDCIHNHQFMDKQANQKLISTAENTLRSEQGSISKTTKINLNDP